jgi:acyl-coenzyme A synthetase/AMP-(fatty) acid ligase
MIEAISGQTAYVYPPAATIPTAALVMEGLKHTEVIGVLGGPTMVAECAKSPDLLDFLASRVSYMCFGGGDIAQGLGDVVSSKLKLYTTHGSTESGAYPLIRRRGPWDARDWKYFQPHPAAGLQFRKYDDNLYEAIIVRNSDSNQEQPVFKLFPDLQEFATKDLYSPHPTKPNLWVYRSRSDDMINLSTAMMANPNIMEDAVLTCNGVKSALMVPVQRIGTEKYCMSTALLVESTSTEALSAQQEAEFVVSLWPVIQKTNKHYRTEACISKANIVFVTPEKPLPRNAKGGIQRHKVLEVYKEEIDELAKSTGL